MLTNRFLTLFLCGAFSASAQVQTLTFFNLPSAPENSSSGQCAINDSGTIASSTSIDGNSQAFVLEKGVFTILETPPGRERAFVAGINASGAVVGLVTGGPGLDSRGVVVWKNGFVFPVTLPPLSSSANSALPTPRAINNSGRILLQMNEQPPSGPFTAVRHYLVGGGGPITELPPYPVQNANLFYTYRDLNDAGEVAGFAQVIKPSGDIPTVGFVYRNGAFTTFEVEGLVSVAGINAQGEVFGQLSDSSFFAWNKGKTRIFPPLIVNPSAFVNLWNSKNQTCGAVRVFRHTDAAVSKKVVITFNEPDGKNPK